jgi:signal transduction histidine kinase
MDARAQSALLLAIVAAALATAMLLRPSRSRPFILFALLNADVSAWGASRFLSSVVSGSWPARLESAAAMLLPAAVLSFLLEFLGHGSPAARRTLRTLSLFGTAGAVAALTQLSSLKPESWSIAPVRLFAAVWAFAGLHGCVLLLHGRMRTTVSRTERARLLYLVVGAAMALGLTLVDLVARDISFPPLGTVATTVYLYFLSQTLLRHRLLDLNELLGKFVVLSLLALLLALIYGLLVSWSVGLTPDASGWTGLFLFNTLIASFVILILFEPLRAKIEGAVVTLLFRERRAFLETLQRLRRRLSTLIDVDEAIRLLLDGLEESRRVTHASVYLLSDDGLGFRRVDARGPAPAAHVDAATARGLLAVVAQGERAVLQETIERRLFELRSQAPGASTQTRPPSSPSAGGDETLLLADLGAALAAMKATVCVPLLGGDRVLGFLALDDDRVQEAFASDELAAMLELAGQLAVVLDNSRLYERMKERDRLAALGEMAAGLAHEIRNPLSSIKGAVQLLEPPAGAGGDDELVGIIVDEVNRLDGVVRQFLDYARPLRMQSQSADVNELVRRTLRLLKARDIPETVVIDEQLDEGLGPVACDPDQLRQVLLNLALNAVQAMEGQGTLTVRTARPRGRDWRAQASGSAPEGVELRVGDTGPGMAEEVRSRLFIPFFTTKEKGTGLGLAICQRIVKAHGGTLRVESRLGEGTTFIIRLPGQTERAMLDLTPASVPRPSDLPTAPQGRRPG